MGPENSIVQDLSPAASFASLQKKTLKVKRVVAGRGASRSIEEGGPLVIYQENLISSAAIVVM